MLTGRHLLSIALVASVALVSGCGTSPPSCGAISLTFSSAVGAVPDVGSGWSGRTAPVVPAPWEPVVHSNMVFTTTNNGHSLVLALPEPLSLRQYDSIQVTYDAGEVGGGATTQAWTGVGSVRVDSLSPTVNLTFINVAMIPSMNVTGTFTINGSGEWTANGTGCSTQ